MGKQHTDQRDRTLTLARILYNETDEFHPLPMTGLMERLEKAGVPSERKSIYRDMEALRRHGLEVEYRPGREGGWYLTGRAFERTELRQLIDAVAAYRWLSETARASLLDKLAAMAPACIRPGLRRPVVRSSRGTGEIEEIRAVLDRIHAALRTGKALTFYPVEWTPEKRKAAAGGRVVVSPKGLLWQEEQYVLVAWNHSTQSMELFCPDRMAGVQLTGMPAQGGEVNLRHWLGAPFGLEPDLRCRVRLKCRRELAGEVLDRFGKAVTLIPEEDSGAFSFSGEVVMGPDFWAWMTAQAGKAELLSPPWAVTLWEERYRPRLPRSEEEKPTKAG